MVSAKHKFLRCSKRCRSSVVVTKFFSFGKTIASVVKSNLFSEEREYMVIKTLCFDFSFPLLIREIVAGMLGFGTFNHCAVCLVMNADWEPASINAQRYISSPDRDMNRTIAAAKSAVADLDATNESIYTIFSSSFSS